MRSDKNNLRYLGRVVALFVIGALICFANVSSDTDAQVVSRQAATARHVPTGDSVAAVRAFQERLKQYLKLRGQISNGVPKLTPKSTPAEIEAHQAAFGEGLRAARAGAKPGDLFTPDVAQHTRHVVSTEVQGARLRD